MYSFDVFDTLITRRTITPRGVFLVMQKKLMDLKTFAFIAKDFPMVRYEAEHNAEKFFFGKEIDIYDIYYVVERYL